MRDSEHPDLFPMQERKAVDVYAHRIARNSVLSDVAAVAAAEALNGRTPDPMPEAASPDDPASAVAFRADGSGEDEDADQDEGAEQHDGHEAVVPGQDVA